MNKYEALFRKDDGIWVLVRAIADLQEELAIVNYEMRYGELFD